MIISDVNKPVCLAKTWSKYRTHLCSESLLFTLFSVFQGVVFDFYSFC